MEKRCYQSCNCDQSVAGNTFTRCSYGTCAGYKCQSCDSWVDSQYWRTCARYSIPTAETPEGELEIAMEEVADLKTRIKSLNRRIRELVGV